MKQSRYKPLDGLSKMGGKKSGVHSDAKRTAAGSPSR